MLEVIAYFVMPILVILVVAYFYVEAQRRKVKEEIKKAIVLRVVTMKDNFKVDLNRLVEQEILTIEAHKSVYRIANNFFVFQPITVENINHCEQLLNNVINAMPTGRINFDLVQEKVNLFVSSLPAAAGGHNAIFYRNELPELIKQLIDSQEDMYETENENSSEAENENSSEAENENSSEAENENSSEESLAPVSATLT